MAANFEPVLTVDVLDAMPDDDCRYELIEGELYVSRAPSLKHQKIVSNIDYAFRKYLDLSPIGMILPGPGVILSKISGVIPDLVYISNERVAEIASRDRVEGPPDLVVEILSPGAENEKRDREAKRQLYGKYGIKEYWIVDPERETVEVYRSGRRKNKLSLTATLGTDYVLTSPLLPGFQCPIRDLFAV